MNKYCKIKDQNEERKSTTCAMGSLSEQEKAMKSQSCDQNGVTL